MAAPSRTARRHTLWLPALLAVLVPALAHAAPPGAASPDQPSGWVNGSPSGFTFPSVPGAEWYQLFIEYDGAGYYLKWFSAGDASCTRSGDVCRIDPGVQFPPGRYRWWIQTFNAYGYGPWSHERPFECGEAPPASLPPIRELAWIDALGFVPNDSSLRTGFGPVGSAGVTGLVITSTSAGSVGDDAPRKAVVRDLEVPPGYLLRGVRVCLEALGPAAAVDGLRITQIGDQPPLDARVVLADTRRFGTNGVATCVESGPVASNVDPRDGTLRLEVGLDFGSAPDVARISLVAVGLRLEGDPHSPLLEAIANHGHVYLTGKGVGHNNTMATTSGAAFGAPTPHGAAGGGNGKKGKNGND